MRAAIQSSLRGTSDLREALAHELRQRHEIKVEHASTAKNYADLLTKVHKTSRYKQLLAVVGCTEEKRHQESLAVGRTARISSGHYWQSGEAPMWPPGMAARMFYIKATPVVPVALVAQQ